MDFHINLTKIVIQKIVLVKIIQVFDHNGWIEQH
jgi:hypothetical protein